MASLKYRSQKYLQRTFQWLGFDSLFLFPGRVRGRHPKLYFQSSFLWCDWRTECLEDCPLTPGLGLEQPRPAWPRHSLGLAPRSRGRGQSGRWDEAVMSSGLLWPPSLASQPNRHSTQRPPCCQQTKETLKNDMICTFLKLNTGYQFGKRRYFLAHVNWSYLDIWWAFKISPKSAKILISYVFRGAECSIYIFPTLNLHQSLNNIFPL